MGKWVFVQLSLCTIHLLLLWGVVFLHGYVQPAGGCAIKLYLTVLLVFCVVLRGLLLCAVFNTAS